MNTTHALELNIDPERIGMMGFSAGGYLTAFIGTHFDNGMMEPESRNAQIVPTSLARSPSQFPLRERVFMKLLGNDF